MRTYKDPKKFGKDKPPKNRYSKKGWSTIKEWRKDYRKHISYIKDCLVHHREVPIGTNMWDLSKAEKELILTKY